MSQDKYSAVWVSHSSMGDFLKCPRAYFLKNMYKNAAGKKINIVSPALSLGQAVHGAVEGLAEYKAEDRFSQPLLQAFEKEWKKVSGMRGGFKSAGEEKDFKARGIAMVERVMKNPGPLKNKTVKLPPSANDMPPNFFLSDDDNIILCGKIDWLEFVPEDNSIRVLDFKTGAHDEKEDSLQLPIYRLLLEALQKRTVSGAAYWYLDRSDVPEAVTLPASAEAKERVLAVARKVKAARAGKNLSCPRGEHGCFACAPFERILRGEATHVGRGEYGQELFMG